MFLWTVLIAVLSGTLNWQYYLFFVKENVCFRKKLMFLNAGLPRRLPGFHSLLSNLLKVPPSYRFVFAHFKYLCLQTFHFENTCQVYMNTALPPTRAVLQILSTEFLASQILLSVSRHGKKKSNKQNNLKKHYF